MKFTKATLCLSVILALTACSEKESVDSHLVNAKSYILENKLNESIIELKNAIRADNKNAEARFLLGQVYLNLGDGLAAVKELERAKSFKFAANKVIPLLARAYILTESDDDVIDLSETSKTLANEEQSRYLAYKTLAALRSENIELARASAELADSLTEKGLYSMLASAYIQLADNKFDEAFTSVNRVLTIDKKQPDALMLQGQIATVKKDYKQASVSYKEFLKVQPRSGIVQILLADALLKDEEYQEAEQLADAILAKVSTQPFAHYIKAMVRFNDKDFAQASEHAETALSANFKLFNLQLVAGASAFYLKNWEQSNHHLSTLVKYLPNEHQARKMLAVSQLELGLVDEISATLGDFDGGIESNSQFISSLSFKLLELGAIGEAQKILKQGSVISSEDALQNARQGILKLMMNDPSGMQDLKEAVHLNPELVEAELALAFAALQANDIEQARTIATKWQQKYSDKSGGFNLMASVHIKQKEFDKAEQLLTQSLTLEPDNIFALTEQLRIARIQKDEKLSKERVDYLINLYPSNNKVLRHYYGIYHNEDALNKISKSFDLDTSDIQKAMLLSEALVDLKQLNKAKSVLIAFENNTKLPKRYWQLLALIYRQQQETTDVISVLEKWRKASPYHIEPVALLADIYATQRNYDRALNVVKNSFEYHPDSPMLQLIQMQLLLNSRQTEQAKDLYQKLAVQEINEVLKQGLLGRILLLERKYPQAVPKLENFYNTYSSSQNAVYLTGAYLGNNEKNKAIKLLEGVVKAQPKNSAIKTMLAGLYLGGDENKAIVAYADIVKSQPKNVVANNNLAWLYLEQGKLDKAFEHAKLAFELAPQNANVVDTYSKVLLKQGDKRAALKQASTASELAKGKDIDIELNYIEVLIANGRSNKAKTLLEKVEPKTAVQSSKKERLTAQL